jgi:hypothetical protein
MKKFNAPIKDTHSKASTLDNTTGSLTMPSEMVFAYENNPGTAKHCNFTIGMFDPSCKEVVIAAWHALKWREDSGKNSKTTNNRFLFLKSFIVFMTEYSLYVGKPLTLSDVDADFFDAWKGFVKREMLTRICVSNVKSLLLEMADLGYLSRGFIMANYPKKTHLNANKNATPTEPYSKFVNRQITEALRKELARIDTEAGEMSSFDITVCLLAIQQANGCDPTGLREASIDCLQDNPFDPTKRVLLLKKRRGDSTQISGAKYSESNTLLSQVGHNIIPIIVTVKARNSAIRSELKGDDRQRVFVFRSRGKVATLSISTALNCMKKLVEKYNIVDDDNNLVSLSVRRLRATYLANIYELSGFNTALAARYGQHSLSVANKSYRIPTPEARKQFPVAIESIVQELSSGVATSAASCADIKNGEGNHLKSKGLPCMEILGCFRCKDMVVTKNDLAKLLSLKWAIIRERDSWANGNVKLWKQRFRDVLKSIDEIVDTFQTKYPKESPFVEQLKIDTKTNPHPTWRDLRVLKQQIALTNQLRMSGKDSEEVIHVAVA